MKTEGREYRGTTIWPLGILLEHCADCSTMLPTGEWVPARPIGRDGWAHRFKAAWMVWRGRADVVVWPGGQ